MAPKWDQRFEWAFGATLGEVAIEELSTELDEMVSAEAELIDELHIARDRESAAHEREAEALGAALAARAVRSASLAGFIQPDDHVVQHRASAGAHFEASHPLVLLQVKRDDKVAVNVRAIRGHGERLGHGHNEIRLT